MEGQPASFQSSSYAHHSAPWQLAARGPARYNTGLSLPVIKPSALFFFMILCETITGLFWFPHISLRVASHLNLHHKEVRKRQWKDNLYSTTVRSENAKLTFKSSQQASESKEGLRRHFHMTHVNLLNESDSMVRSPQNILTLTFWNAADNNRTIQIVYSLWLCGDGSRSAPIGLWYSSNFAWPIINNCRNVFIYLKKSKQ